MKKLNFDIGILFSKNLRSLHYLNSLKKNKIIPKLIIDFPNNKITKNINNKHKSEIKKKLLAYKFFKKNTKVFKTNKTKKNLINIFSKSKINYFIFAGNYGQILPKEFFNYNKKIIHVHPGDLPYFKGSTTNYYEYLIKNTVTYTSIFLNKYLDKGKILIKKKYNPRKINFKRLDNHYDSIYRSETLLDTLKFLNHNKKKKIFKKNKKFNKYYYVIHPLLKYLTIMKSKNII